MQCVSCRKCHWHIYFMRSCGNCEADIQPSVATDIKHPINEIEIRRSEEQDLMFWNYVHATH